MAKKTVITEDENFDFKNIKFGCKLSPADIRDYQVKAKAVNVQVLPEEFELPISGKIKNQYSTGSCVAHSVSEILEYFAKQDLDETVRLSTQFIYGTQKKLYNRDGEGMILAEACRTVTKYGDPLYDTCPYNDEVPSCYAKAEPLLEDQKVLKEAYKYHIDSYFNCSSVNDIKYALTKYGPVLIAIKWYDEYEIVDSETGEIWFNTNTDYGYHALMLYGYNKKGWLIQNSWGPRFGKNGLFLLPYDYKIAEAKVLIDYINPKEDREDPKEDDNLVIPNTINWAEIIVKLINGILNLFKKK